MELYRIVDRSNSRWKLLRRSCDGPLEREPGNPGRFTFSTHNHF